MRALVALLATLLSIAPALAGTMPQGTAQRYDMPAPSLGEAHRVVRVYLPPSYGESASRERRYPVIVMLHGWPGSDGNWLAMGHAAETADSLIAEGRLPESILVFPNGAGKGLLGRSMWMNSQDGSSRLGDFLATDLPAWVDRTFRTDARPERRAVIGLSDGGTAAVMLLLQHGDVYRDAASHSATFRLHKELGMGGILGPEPGASKWLDDHSPAVALARGDLPPPGAVLYIECGTADESLEDNRAFHRDLEAKGVPHQYQEFPGTHDWGYWRAHLAQSLMAVTARWK